MRNVKHIPSDVELVAGLRARDPHAFEALDRRYRRPLRAHAARLLQGTGVDADDVVQDTLVRAWTALPADRPVVLPAWLHTVLHHRALDLLRSQRVRRAAPDGGERAGPHDAYSEAACHETIDEVVSAVRRLPLRQSTALVKSALDGRSHDEIARELGTTSRAAKMLVHRARRRLAEAR